MKKVTRIQTRDGVIHEDEKEANKHLDNLYGVIIRKLADSICDLLFQQGHPVLRVCEYITEHLESFQELARIRRDMEMEENES